MALIGKACRECGKGFSGKRPSALFCGGPCRQAFNRRRRDRGAELYDFVMVKDTDTIKGLVDAYKTADKALREGRPSWQPTRVAIMNIPAAYGSIGDKR